MDPVLASKLSRLLIIIVVYAACIVASWSLYGSRLEKVIDGVERFFILLAVALLWSKGINWLIFDLLGLFPIIQG